MIAGRTHTWLARTALAVFAVVGAVPVRGLVLCIGEDGHVALEAAGAQASCFDCPTESPPIERVDVCCSPAGDLGSSCTCSDVLLLAGDSVRVRPVAIGLVDLPPPSCFPVDREIDAAAFALRGADLRARSTSPPCPRAPTNPILRV